MKKSMKVIILLSISLYNTILFSQKEVASDNHKITEDVFRNLQQEKFFLHTNKATYFSGENIHWKAYVVSDFNDRPITNTSNLHVNFYNSQKVLISHQLFLCKEGRAFGEITLDEELQTGTYYINLETQWNKNFDAKYVVPINIINTISDENGNRSDNNHPNLSDGGNLEMLFYPESGGLLGGINNTVYFTINKGSFKVADIQGYIFNDNTSKKIAKVESNAHGHGVFKLLYNKNHSYSAHITLGKQVHTFKINQKKPTDLIIQKKVASNNKSHTFSVKTSQKLSKLYNGRTLFAAVHRNNKLLFIVPFEINTSYRSYSLQFVDENLFNGVNTISIFNDENKLIAERSFFNNNIDELDYEIIRGEKSKDSIKLDFRLKDSIKSNLSISVLPKQTKLNHNPNSILDDFLVNPYTRNKTPTNLFFKSNLSDLEKDVFLQIHSKRTPFSKAAPMFKKEQGLTIRGSINTPIENLDKYRVLLSSTENEILLLTAVEPDNSFEFNHLNLKEKSNYRLALLNKKGNIVKAGFYLYPNKYKPDSLLVHTTSPSKIITEDSSTEKSLNDYIEPFDSSTRKLDEVIVYGEQRENELIEETYPNNPEELGNGFSKNLKIDEKDRLGLTVFEFLNNQMGVSAFGNEVEASVVIHRARYNSLTGDKDALILLNGFPTDAAVLAGIQLIDVKSIKINAIGAGYGLRGGNGVVAVELGSETDATDSTPNENYFISHVDLGFSASKSKFETSSMVFPSELSRSYYETLDWIPNIDLKPNTSNILKVHRGAHQHIKLFINGINDHGQLSNKEIDLFIEDKL